QSARSNPLFRMAQDMGVRVKLDEGHTAVTVDGRTLDKEELDAFWAAQRELYGRIYRTGHAGLDIAASEVAEADPTWQAAQLVLGQLEMGAELDQVSVLDVSRYTGGSDYYLVPDGYGSFIAGLGAGLPVRLGVAAQRIDTTGRRVRVE